MAAKTRRKQWSDEATHCLISLWAEETIQVSLDACKSARATSNVYKILLSQLEENGYKGFTLKELINKIKKLRQRYRKEKERSRQTGMGVLKKWKFFNEIDAFLTVRHDVNPLKIIDTMAEGDEQGVHEFDDGEQGRLENSSFDQAKYDL
ncbi:uncharacterized protein LOC124456888 [Xenia sp. Carnegie-2017]|uniref:uncharacterized protein LOC124456888 n=1 Tax=Xenia sp. Carnegie-2017 TaxID=2897299 RepID=UPI001F04068C|nr:uncharacterized protein LOC124456888 [Xenia sp. Carnegie-2017]